MYEGNDTLESPPSYLRGDIVWVKLSGYWWPGEVKNEEDLPSDLLSDFKKPPLVIVKFFEEDSYEYIKHWSNIYPYNCDKKSEFIKKGMAGFRAKLAHLAKFPRDIGTAEEKTNGNPNILSQPEFLPIKKLNYDEIFGTPSPKKSAKGKGTSSASKKPTSKDNNKPLITHRRFLGNDDYKAYIWVQYTGKDREADSDDEEIQKLNKEPQKVLTCPSCSFKSKRLGVMLMHSKMHLDGVYVTTKRKIKKPKEDVDSETETASAVVKPPKPKQRKKKVEVKPKPVDVFTNLLNEWNDTDEEMDETNNVSKSKLEVTESEDFGPDVTIDDDSKTTSKEEDKLTTNHEAVEPPAGKNTHDDIKNCFDFDEEEEDDDFLLPASTGRKIPRVIPEKPRASISELLELSQKEDDDDDLLVKAQGESVEPTTPMEPETDTSKKEILRINQSDNKPMSVDDSIEHSFKELMEETEMPALEALTQTLKPEQNFHDARTIKFPDKGGTTLKGGTSSKCGTSKKRFVTSFDDFEAGFRKIEDEERRRLSADKEGKRNKKQAVKDDNTDSSLVLEAPKENVDAEVDKTPEDNLLLLGSVAELEPQSDASTSKQVAESDDKRKTQSTEANSSKPSEITDIVAAKEIESKRKSRRRTRQLVIEEGSEELIEFAKDEDGGHKVEDTEKIVNQLEAFDTEIEAIKKDLEIEQKIDNTTEDTSSKEATSLEQLTMDLEGSGDSGDFKAVAESPKKSRRKSKLEENVPKKLEISIEEPISKKKSAKHKKSSKSHLQSADQEEEVVLPATEETVAENVAIFPTSSSVKTRRGRSKGFQEDLNFPLEEEAAKSSQLSTVNTTVLEQSTDISESKIDVEHTDLSTTRKSLRDKHHKAANNDENIVKSELSSTKQNKSQKHKKDEDSTLNDVDETKSDVGFSDVTSELNKEDQTTALSEPVQPDKATPRRGRSKKIEVQVASASKDTSQGLEATTTNSENEEASSHRKSRTRKPAKPEEETSSVVPAMPEEEDVVAPIESALVETLNDPAASKTIEPAAQEDAVSEFDEKKECPKPGRLRKRIKKEQEPTDLKQSLADAPIIPEPLSEPKDEGLDVKSSDLAGVVVEPASASTRSKSGKHSKSESVPEIDIKDSKTSGTNINEELISDVRRGRSRKIATNDDIILPVTASDDVTDKLPPSETKDTEPGSEHVVEATEPTISEPIKSEQTPSETDIKPTTKRRRGKTRWHIEEPAASTDIPKSISEADKIEVPAEKIEVFADKIEISTDSSKVDSIEPVLAESSKPSSRTRKARSRHREEESTSSTLEEAQKPVDVTDGIAMSHSEEVQQQECLKLPEPTAIEKSSQPVTEETLEIQQADKEEVKEPEGGLADSNTSVFKGRRSKSRKHTTETVTELERPKEGISVTPNLPDFDRAIEKTDCRPRKGRGHSDPRKEDATPIEHTPSTNDLPESKSIHDLPVSEQIDKSVKSSSSKSADKYHKRKSSRLHERETELSSASTQHEAEPDTNQSNADVSQSVEDSALEQEIVLESSTRSGKHRKRKYTEEIHRPEPYDSKDTRNERRRSRSQKKEMAVTQTQSAVDLQESSLLNVLAAAAAAAAAATTSEDHLNSTHSVEKSPGLRKSGIISDKVYGRKSKEVRADKSKSSKSRWDVVAPIESQPEVSASTSHVPEGFQQPMEVAPLAQDSEALPSSAMPEIEATSNDKSLVPSKENSDICVEEVTGNEQPPASTTFPDETGQCEVPQPNNQHEQGHDVFKASIVEDVANQSVITEASGSDKTVEEKSDSSVLESHNDVEEHTSRRKGRRSKKTSIPQRDGYAEAPKAQDNVEVEVGIKVSPTEEQPEPVPLHSDETQSVEEHNISKGKRRPSRKSSALAHVLLEAQKDDVEIMVSNVVEEERQYKRNLRGSKRTSVQDFSLPEQDVSASIEVTPWEAHEDVAEIPLPPVEKKSEPVSSQVDDSRSEQVPADIESPVETPKVHAAETIIPLSEEPAVEAQFIEERRSKRNRRSSRRPLPEVIESQVEPPKIQQDVVDLSEIKLPPTETQEGKEKPRNTLAIDETEEKPLPAFSQTDVVQPVEERSSKRKLRGSRKSSITSYIEQVDAANVEKQVDTAAAYENIVDASTEQSVEQLPAKRKLRQTRKSSLGLNYSDDQIDSVIVEKQLEDAEVHQDVDVAAESVPLIVQTDKTKSNERPSQGKRRSSRRTFAIDYYLPQQEVSACFEDQSTKAYEEVPPTGEKSEPAISKIEEVVEHIVSEQAEAIEAHVDVAEIKLPMIEAESVPIAEENVSVDNEFSKDMADEVPLSEVKPAQVDETQHVDEPQLERKLRRSRKSSAPDYSLFHQIESANIEATNATKEDISDEIPLTEVKPVQVDETQALEEPKTERKLRRTRKSLAPDYSLLDQIESASIEATKQDISNEIPLTEAKPAQVDETQAVEEPQSERKLRRTRKSLAPNYSLPDQIESASIEATNATKESISDEIPLVEVKPVQVDETEAVEEPQSERKLRRTRKSLVPDYSLPDQIELASIEATNENMANEVPLTEVKPAQVYDSQLVEEPQSERKFKRLRKISAPDYSLSDQIESTSIEATKTTEENMAVEVPLAEVKPAQVAETQPVEEPQSERKLRRLKKRSAPDYALSDQIESASIEAIIENMADEVPLTELKPAQVDETQPVEEPQSARKFRRSRKSSAPVYSLSDQIESTSIEATKTTEENMADEVPLAEVKPAQVAETQPVEEPQSERKLRCLKKRSAPDYALSDQIESASIEAIIENMADEVPLTELKPAQVDETQPVEEPQSARKFRRSRKSSAPVYSLSDQIESASIETTKATEENMAVEVPLTQLKPAQIDETQLVAEPQSERKLRRSRKSSAPENYLSDQIESASIEATKAHEDIINVAEIELPSTESESVASIEATKEYLANEVPLIEVKPVQVDETQPVEELQSERKLRRSRKSSAPDHSLPDQIESVSIEATKPSEETMSDEVPLTEVKPAQADETQHAEQPQSERKLRRSRKSLAPDYSLFNQIESASIEATKESMADEVLLTEVKPTQVDETQPVEELQSERKLRRSRKSPAPDHSLPIEPIKPPEETMSDEVPFTEIKPAQVDETQPAEQPQSERKLRRSRKSLAPDYSLFNQIKSASIEATTESMADEAPLTEVKPTQVDETQPAEELQSERKLRRPRKSSAPDHSLSDQIESASIEATKAHEDIINVAEIKLSTTESESVAPISPIHDSKSEDQPFKRRLRSTRNTLEIDYSIPEENVSTNTEPYTTTEEKSKPFVSEIGEAQSVDKHRSERKLRGSRKTSDYFLPEDVDSTKIEKQLEVADATEKESIPAQSEELLSKIKRRGSRRTLARNYFLPQQEVSDVEAPIVDEAKVPFAKEESVPNVSKVDEERSSLGPTLALDYSLPANSQAEDIVLKEQPLIEEKSEPVEAVEQHKSKRKRRSSRKTSEPDYSLQEKHDINDQVEEPKPLKDISDKTEVKDLATEEKSEPVSLQADETHSKRKRRRSLKSSAPTDLLTVDNVLTDFEPSKAHEENVETVEGESQIKQPSLSEDTILSKDSSTAITGVEEKENASETVADNALVHSQTLSEAPEETGLLNLSFNEDFVSKSAVVENISNQLEYSEDKSAVDEGEKNLLETDQLGIQEEIIEEELVKDDTTIVNEPMTENIDEMKIPELESNALEPSTADKQVLDLSDQHEQAIKDVSHRCSKLQHILESFDHTKKEQHSKDSENLLEQEKPLETLLGGIVEDKSVALAEPQESTLCGKYSIQESTSDSKSNEPIDYSTEATKTVLEIDYNKPIELVEKRGRGRPRKSSSESNSHEATAEPSTEKAKLAVPPKKNRWSRRASYTKTDNNEPDIDVKDEIVPVKAVVSEETVVEEQANSVIEKTDSSSLEAGTTDNSTTSSFNDSELILPLKKSKRVSEVTSHFLRDSFSDDPASSDKKCDNDILSFPSFDDSFMSTSLRNNIEGLIKEIDSIGNNTMPDNFDIPEVRALSSDNAFTNSPLSEDSRGGLKEDLEIPKCVPPKKKKIDIPKDESLSVNNLLANDLSKAEEKVIESIPQAPKKKMQKLFESSQAFEKSEKLTELPLMSPLAKKKSFLFHQEEFDQEYRADELSQKKDVHKLSHYIDNTVEEYMNLPKARKKRKSSSYGDCLPKKEKLDDLFNFEDNQIEPKKEIEENDFKFSNLVSSQAPATKTQSDTNEQNSSQLTEELSKKEEIIPPFEPPHEPELVPISGTPTVMSEQDLADAQVEITSDKVISEKKVPTYAPGQTKKKATETVGTEFTSKAMVKEFDNRLLMSKPNAYVLKSELLDILEGNSNSSTNSSGSEQKFKTSFDNYDKKSTVQGIIDFEDAIPSQIVLSNKVNPESVLLDSPKLLERLSISADASKVQKVVIQSDVKVPDGLPKSLMGKIKRATGIPKPGQKIVIKTPRTTASTIVKASGSKPIILSEQIIRPANAPVIAVKPPVQPQGTKRQYEDIEDLEAAFIIPKISKKVVEEEEVVPPTPPEKPARSRGSKSSCKAKILQQTIITPKGEIIPQTATTTATQAIQLQTVQVQPTADDSVFDINSMPIVLSDDLLTPESIQNMPVVLSEDVLPQTASVSAVKSTEKVLATLPKKIVATLGTKQIIFKTTQPASSATVPAKHTSKARILSSSTTPHGKVHKTGATALLATGTTPDGKQAKYVLVPPSVTPAATQVKSVKQIIKKQPVSQAKVTPSSVVSVTDSSNQTAGNKIMIVTNAQGQQTRVVLTPQQQKAFMQAQGASKTKTIIKSTLPKSFLESATAAAAAGPSGVAAKTVTAIPQGASPTVSSHGGLLMPAVKTAKAPVPPKKNVQRTTSKPQKTILIKNQLGQTVRKIQGTDDADLDRQVAEQLEAIKASARLQQASRSPEIINYTNRPLPTTATPSNATNKSAMRRSYSKKIESPKVKTPVSSPLVDVQQQAETSVPALAPLSPQPRIPQVQNQTIQKQGVSKKIELTSSASKTVEALLHQQPQQATVPAKSDSNKQQSTAKSIEINRPESPLRQVVIQDGLGNLTTVTVGQILAIPSETVDGQPQSYMLVTVDESGNLTPLNNDALMSLDPSLGAGGDINNMVLQVDQGQATVAAIKPAEFSLPAPIEEKAKVEELLKPELPKPPKPVKEPKVAPVELPKPQEVPLAVEQQIVIGEGVLPGDAGGQQLIVTGDPIATQKFLESLSDGSTDLANILANAEGGSVIIQADGQQILIRTNAAAQPMMGMTESTEGGGNPMFATHKPNQDILAAALANTDVFQPTDPQGNHSSPVKGLASSQLSPGGGASLYPMHVSNVLETSLTLSSPIMTPLEVPSTNTKKIDDEADILNQVPKNVDLPITITDPNIVQTVAHQQAASLLELTLPISETGHSVHISSPSYSYSLSALDDSVGISQKSFSSSMPLLTEDVVEVESSTCSDPDRISVTKSLESVPSGFSPNFGSLPMLSESIESSREEIVKTSAFGDIGSLPLLSDDVIEDSGSSIGSTKPPRSSPKTIERDMVDEGLSTLGGEMCSSLSEPPPDMFDLSSITAKEEEISSDISSIPEPETLSVNSENSGEIPIQPPIVASLSDLKRSGDETDGSDEKRSRFD